MQRLKLMKKKGTKSQKDWAMRQNTCQTSEEKKVKKKEEKKNTTKLIFTF